MKVDKGFVVELKQEVSFQLNRIRKEIERSGARDGLLQSLYRLKRLKELLNGLLRDGEVVLTGCIHLVNEDEEKKAWMQRWLKAVINDEDD
ncbi:MAG: hypothetical protein RMK89_11715 [Armatimonadota bacterium]|nr:hypothetical protein [Armatimonadota bacterium]MDW8144115.1 hypothetical protein [Armatimonadota bacterium]